MPGCALLQRHGLLLAAGLHGAWCVIAQLVLTRELLATFAGNEMVAGLALGAWLLWMGLGAWLGQHLVRRLPPRTLFLALLAGLPGLLPFYLAAMRLLLGACLIRGAEPGPTPTVLAIFGLLGPCCLLAGAMLPAACAALAAHDLPSPPATPDAAIRRVYVADSLGSMLGGALFSLLLVRWLEDLPLLAVLGMMLVALAAGLFLTSPEARARQRLAWAACSLAGLFLLAGVFLCYDLEARTLARQHPGQRILFQASSPYGRLVVTEQDQQITFYQNGRPTLFSPALEQSEEPAHFLMAQRPRARQVLVVGGAFSGTVREILKYPLAQVTVVEPDPLLIAAAQRCLTHALDNPRVRLLRTDGRLFLKQTTGRYDVILLDPPPPDTWQLNRFYAAEGFAAARRLLTPDGVLGISLGQYENRMSPELAAQLATLRQTLLTAFPEVRLLPGSRVFFLASASALHTSIAETLEREMIPARLVRRSYLEVQLSPERLASVERAAASPAPVNRDFAPVLYYQHLRHWLSQFPGRPELPVWILGLAGLVCAWRLRPVTLAVSASGLAASALHMVLLLGLQALYGSLYQHLGLMVAAFMAGLAAGAALTATRWLRTPPPRPLLAAVILLLAALAASLPFLLQSSLLARRPELALGGMALMAFGLAVLIGLAFPLACRLSGLGETEAAARLYTADFLGASLGAVLASLWLIPLGGMAGACGTVAGINTLAGLRLLMRKK